MFGHTIDLRFRFRFSAESKTSAFGRPLLFSIISFEILPVHLDGKTTKTTSGPVDHTQDNGHW